jgi:Tfp pilus assembly protein PilN
MEDWESLTTVASQETIRSRRMRTLYASAVALGLALVGALFALDYARATYEARLDRAIAVAEQEAQPGLALRRRLAGLEREAQLLRASATTTDAAQALAALSELLPRSVVVTRLRMMGDEWQASGRARGGDAAAVVPALERDSRFSDVRMTSPSTRFREDAGEFESFSVAFRVRSSD